MEFGTNLFEDGLKVKPHEIKEYLDEYIIGQDEAKRTLAVAIYNHYKKVFANKNSENENNNNILDKSNILLAGNTGCGKTLIVKTIAKMLGVPCYIGNATSITESGYVGDDVESLLVGLLRECDYDIEIAEMGGRIDGHVCSGQRSILRFVIFLHEIVAVVCSDKRNARLI